MKVRITMTVELDGYNYSEGEERDALIACLTDKDEPSYLHSNVIGDTVGRIVDIEQMEEVK